MANSSQDKPKVLLGDVFATLMGDGIRFKGKRTLEVGASTHLVVLGYSTACNPERTAYLQAQVCTLRQHLCIGNASIGQVFLDTFVNECQLEATLRRHVAAAVGIV